MITHNLVQGSPAWLAHRSNYWNAGDAAAMMGKSKYETRSEFLHRICTGIVPDVDAYTQRIFDEGHEFEALARPLAEEIIGESLYPVTGTDGKYSASFDGLTMLEDVAFEHKRLNNAIRAAQSVEDLDAMYHIQMEHQCLVSGAKKVLFLASNWDDEGNLLEEKHFWYEPNLELRERIIQGWIQLEKDRASYVPVIHPEKPKAEAIMQLPALAVQIRGEVTSSNLKQYREAAEHFIAGIKTDLQTDEDFANAEETVRFCDKAEKELELTKKAAIAQTASIGELMRTIDHIKNQLRDKRLMLDKLVKTQKEAIKEDIISKGKKAFIDHVAALDAEIHPIRLIVQQPDFIAVVKNKRTLASLHDSVDTALAIAKIAANEIAGGIRSKLAWHKENAVGYEFLFADMQQIVFKEVDDFQMLVQNRIAQHKKNEADKLEAERVRIQAEEQLKAKQQIEQQKPVEDAPKPTEPFVLVKVEAKPAVSVSPALMGLALADASHFRKKYASIPGLAAVMREIDSFLAANAPEEARGAR